jgi:hypothetical protein
MKKYLILGIIVIALALTAGFLWKPSVNADVGPPSFYGTAGAGSTVYAFLQIEPYTVYTTIARPNNTYSFHSNILMGPYIVCDFCQPHYETYSGTPVRVNICYSHDGKLCPCL